MPKPSISNSPSRNSNRPSSPSKGAHPMLRSVSDQTSKPATPGKQRRTVSSSTANGKEGSVPVKLPTTLSELQEVQNPTLFPSLPDPTLSSQNSTPRKADKSRAVLPPSPGENGLHSLALHVFMLLPSTETTPKTYRRSPRGHNTVTPTTPPVLDPLMIFQEKTSSEMEIAGASNRSAQPKSRVPKNSGIADSLIDGDTIPSTKLQPSLQTPVPKGKQRRKASLPAAIEDIVFSKNPTSPMNPLAAQSDLAERQKPPPLPSVSDPAQSLRKSKPRKSEKLAGGSPRSPGENCFHSFAPFIYLTSIAIRYS